MTGAVQGRRRERLARQGQSELDPDNVAEMRVLATMLILLLLPAVSAAQTVWESVGVRALGMGGAFVAVADDATAVYWNPAGLVAGAPGNATMEWAHFRTGNQSGPPVAGPTRRTSKFVSLGTWPVGLSYAKFEEAGLVAAPGGSTRAELLSTSQFGATIVQTLISGLVVGSTLKYIRGKAVTDPVVGASAGDALQQALKFDGHSSGHFDYDLGAMADFGRARLGLTVHNLRSSRFVDTSGSAITLQRQARLGVAVLPTSGLTLAMDVDLDTVILREGPRRMVALGGEDRLGRWAVRAGVRWNRDGAKHTVAATGLSVAVRQSLWLDGYYSQGRSGSDREFGAALRAGF